MSRGTRRFVTGLLLVGLLAVVVPPGAVPAQAAGGFSQTKTVTRQIMAEDGTVTVDERTVTVNADVTTDLRGRQVMAVRWSGAHPSGGIVGDIASSAAWERTEYPVVVLQCRGDDSSSDPTARIRPETCWTTIASTERRWTAFGELYVHDKYATEAERAPSIPSADDWTRLCGDESFPGDENWPKRIIPFVAVDGTEYWSCAGETAGKAPEMGSETALGWNERISYSAPDGTGMATFEVRTAAENASLGCSAAVPCAVVVIPIMGISCDTPDPVCNQESLNPPGTALSSDNTPFSRSVVGRYWASESNWRNRVTIPVQIAPTDAICTDVEGRPTLQLYGSSLMSGAAEQWAPSYCTRPDRFVLRINDQIETRAFSSLEEGYGNGVLATYGAQSASVPLGYAPVGLTGFAIGFVVDMPGGGGQLEHLNLTPRLLVKLLTASYWGMNPSGAALAERPDLAKNPRSLQLDPEFRAINPALDVENDVRWNRYIMGFSQLGSLSVPSDLTTALTSYIAADPEAMAFVNGTPDQWGMRVNSAYEGISLPLVDWPLADPWMRPTNNDPEDCEVAFPIPWFSRVQAPLSDIHKLADVLLTGKPSAISNYVRDRDFSDMVVCKTSGTAQSYGSRAMLALVTLADAKRYALPTASLRTATGAYVAPTDASITAAAGFMTSAGPGEPFVPDAGRLIASPSAYPGTMVVHAALPLSGVERDQAAVAASFVRVATSEGQLQGTKAGQLPAGYAPIASTGATAPLYAAAQAVADAVERQSGSVADTGTNPGVSPEVVDTVLPIGLDALAQALSSLADVPAAEPEAVDGLPAPESATTAKPRRDSTVAAVFNMLRNAIPAGLALTAAAAVGVPVLRRFRVER